MKIEDETKSVKAMHESRNPKNTCAASRHVELIAERLVAGKPCPMLADEPGFCGESMAATVTALWAARDEIKRLRTAIRRALEDSESGDGWGPDITVCGYLREAMEPPNHT